MNMHITDDDTNTVTTDTKIACPHCDGEIQVDQLDGFNLEYLGTEAMDEQGSTCPHCENDFYWEMHLYLDLKTTVSV
ncbi:MAG: hypothetical protein GY862_28400 [Gammaproteobacteria bacterium]|nr:hypothetical protein [Gammaproteobacteria bacterium]